MLYIESGHDCFLSYPFQFTFTFIQPFNPIHYEIWTASLSKLQTTIFFSVLNVSASSTADGLPTLMEGLVIAVDRKSENISKILDSLISQIQASGCGKPDLFYNRSCSLLLHVNMYFKLM